MAPAAIADPVSLTIPLIGVRTSVITLGRAADGTMQVPTVTTVAGWYDGSALPGAIGPAVIVGHVDSTSGPGVFRHLSARAAATASTSRAPTGPRRCSG